MNKKKKKLSKGGGEDDRGHEGVIKGDAEVIAHKSQSSVTIKRDAKGGMSYEVKAYADDVNEAEKLATKVAKNLSEEFEDDDEEEEE